jgi:hypothetical protein
MSERFALFLDTSFTVAFSNKLPCPWFVGLEIFSTIRWVTKNFKSDIHHRNLVSPVL